MSRIVDLGAGDDPDDRATETVDLYCEADHRFDLGAEWELADESVDGLIANHVLEHLDAEHFFREAGRVLEDGGFLEVTLPVGRDARADPTHRNHWTYWTPRMYCRTHRAEADRPWDTETAFVLTDREIDLWLLGPFARLSPLFNALSQQWPHWGVERCGSGELTARYRRVSR